MIEVPAGQVLVQSVDFFRTFIDDPFVFGEIAAVHALGDVWAMGARPHSALALAVVPAAAERLMEEDLFQMLAGARSVLDAAGCALIGGHSGEGPEAALGFSVNGLVDPARALRKGGLRIGDRLVLTKPLGTGVLFAAAMRGAARATWIEGALASMRRPSGPAAERFAALGAHACTDVTGFGLAGHLAEMIRATGKDVAVELSLEALPVLPGAAELFARGFASSLQPEKSARPPSGGRHGARDRQVQARAAIRSADCRRPARGPPCRSRGASNCRAPGGGHRCDRYRRGLRGGGGAATDTAQSHHIQLICCSGNRDIGQAVCRKLAVSVISSRSRIVSTRTGNSDSGSAQAPPSVGALFLGFLSLGLTGFGGVLPMRAA